ncbi:MAG: hypothetical protein ACOYYS_22230 [Chloroflexota bacterium]
MNLKRMGKMMLAKFIADQLAHPAGIPGRLAALTWNRRNDFDTHCMFSIFFEGYGHQVDIAKSFDDCFEICKNQPPTVLMIHRCIHNPNDGLDFIRKIRSCSDIPYFPVIVGWADYPFNRGEKHRHYEVAFEAGANACFGAVFDTTDVLRQVETLAANPEAKGLIDR